MVYSSATSVSDYLAELDPARRQDIQRLRELLLENFPTGLEEVMNWGMISYQVPLSRFPITYNRQPLMYAALASQKHKISLYLMSIYAFDEIRQEFESQWRKSGKKLDVGKACIRFRSLSEVPLEVIARAASQVSVEDYLQRYVELRQKRKSTI